MRVSTYNQFFGNAAGVTQGQRDMAIAQRQASSQKVASDLKGFGHDAGRLLSAKTLAARLDARAEALKALEARAQVEASALGTFSQAVQTARDAIGNAIANQNAAGLRDALEGALETAFSMANVRYAGESVFSGVMSGAEPAIPASLDVLAAQPNTDPNWVDTGPTRTVVLEDNRAIELSRDAQDVFRPFVDFLRELREWESTNTAFNGTMNAAQLAFLQSQVPVLASVHTGVIDHEGSAGSTARQIEQAVLTHQSHRDALLDTIGDQENVDLAEVAARLSASETQYQASAAIFGRMRDMNLLQYLR